MVNNRRLHSYKIELARTIGTAEYVSCSMRHACRHTGVCGKTLLLGEPLPCNPAAETALEPLIWCSESLFPYKSSSPEVLFFH